MAKDTCETWKADTCVLSYDRADGKRYIETRIPFWLNRKYIERTAGNKLQKMSQNETERDGVVEIWNVIEIVTRSFKLEMTE